MRRFSMLFVVLVGCDSDLWVTEPDFDPMLVATEDGVLWRGFSHEWTYNHRVGRLGNGFAYVDPGQDVDAWPVETWGREGWVAMSAAAAGTGHDLARQETYGTRLVSDRLHFGSLTAHWRLTGREGRVMDAEWTIEVDLPDDMIGADVVEVALNGLWTRAAGDEAKQLVSLDVALGEARVDDDRLAVDASLAATFDCDTPECLGCLAKSGDSPNPRFAYDVYLSVLVVAGDASDMTARRVAGPEVTVRWDGPRSEGGDGACLRPSSIDTCYDYWLACGDLLLGQYSELPEKAGRKQVGVQLDEPWPSAAVGLTGVHLGLDREHHLLGVELSVRDVQVNPKSGLVRFRQTTRFRNWQRAMNELGQDYDRMSVTAFGTRGAFRGALDETVIGFEGVSLSPLEADLYLMSPGETELADPLQHW